MGIKIKCCECGVKTRIEISKPEYMSWKNHRSLSAARYFPKLPDDKHDTLETGKCTDCIDLEFGGWDDLPVVLSA